MQFPPRLPLVVIGSAVQRLGDVAYEVNNVTKCGGAELGLSVCVFQAFDLGLDRGSDTTLRASKGGG
jgi:hypothetical protein